MQHVFKLNKAKLGCLFSHFHLCIKLCKLDYFQQSLCSSSSNNSVREGTELDLDVSALLREDVGEKTIHFPSLGKCFSFSAGQLKREFTSAVFLPNGGFHQTSIFCHIYHQM